MKIGIDTMKFLSIYEIYLISYISVDHNVENSKQESNANVILTSNGANKNHGKGDKVELRNSKNTEGINNSGNVNNMEYANAAWMHDVGSRPHESALTNHDPIITDTNLAEIDFEDFRNEDLAYAFSCGVSCYQGSLYKPGILDSNLKKVKCF